MPWLKVEGNNPPAGAETADVNGEAYYWDTTGEYRPPPLSNLEKGLTQVGEWLEPERVAYEEYQVVEKAYSECIKINGPPTYYDGDWYGGCPEEKAAMEAAANRMGFLPIIAEGVQSVTSAAIIKVGELSDSDSIIKIGETLDNDGVKAAAEMAYEEVAGLLTDLGPTDDNFAEKSRFNNQCWMLANIPRLAYHSAVNINQKFDRAEGLELQLVTGPPGSIVSKMIYHPSYSTFYNMSPDKLSLLQPSLSLYKTLHEDDAGARLETPTEIMIPFPQHMLQQDIAHGGQLESIDMRGGGVGIKDFDWSYQGSNPASSRRDIKADLTLHFQSFNELLKQRTLTTSEGVSHNFRYIDLATRVGKDNSNPGNENSQYYVLKAVVGWGWDDSGTDNFTASEKMAIKASKMTLLLTIIDHEFAVEQDGTLDFKISYRAYIEGALDSPRANVLISGPALERKAKREGLRKQIQDIEKVIDTQSVDVSVQGAGGTVNVDDDQLLTLCDQLKTRKAEYTEFLERDKQSAHAGILERLIGTAKNGADNKIYWDVPEESALKSFVKSGAAGVEEYDPIEADGKTGVLKNPNAKDHVDTLAIGFVYLGDLIDACISNLTDPATSAFYGDEPDQFPLPSPADQFKNMRIVLGPIEITDHKTGELQRYNLADIPISINYFSEWFIRKVTDKDKMEWELFSFIRSLIKEVILQNLRSTDCFGGSYRQKAKFNNLFLTAGDRTSEPIKRKKGLEQTRLNLGTITNKEQLFTMDTTDYAPDETYQYLVIYATDPIPRDLHGDLTEDSLVGIQHFQIGVDRGSVKSINFSKSDAPGLREANFFRGGYDGMKQFKNVYSVSLSMFGDSKLFPGQMVYVDPSGLGYEMGIPTQKDSLSALLGIGGYYMIIGVDNSISAGDFSSDVTAKWVLSGLGTADTSEKVEKDADGEFACPSDAVNDYSMGGAIDFDLTSWIPDSIVDAAADLWDAVTGQDEDGDPE